MVRKVTKEDIMFLLEERFAFLIITSLGLKTVDEGSRIAEEMNLSTLMGWPVSYTPGQNEHRLSCASGHLREELFDEDHGPTVPIENRDEAKFNSHRQQLFKSAGEIILLVIEQGWEGVKIEDGSELFKWSLWAHCTSNNLKVEGYEPTDEDFERLKRCEVLCEPYIYQHTHSYVPILGATESADIPGADEINNPPFVATVDQDTTAPAAEEKSSDSVAEEPQTTESEKTPPKKKSVATKKKKTTLKAVKKEDDSVSSEKPTEEEKVPKTPESTQELSKDDVLAQDNESTEPSIEVTERIVESPDEEDKSVDTLKSSQSTDEIPKDDSNPPETSEQTGSTEQKTKDPFKFDIDSLTDEEKKLLDQEDDDTDNTS